MRLQYINPVWCRVTGEPSECRELSEAMTFEVPGAWHMPSVKQGYWDGKKRLYNLQTGLMYAGLFEQVIKFAEKNEYPIEVDEEFSARNYFPEHTKYIIASANLTKEPRDYQIEAFQKARVYERGIFRMPTGSGKSLTIYLLARSPRGTKTLIVVPRIGLVHQMASDFAEYGMDVENEVHKVQGGTERETEKPITISTWHSVYKESPEFLAQFEKVIVDEVHDATANSIVKLMEKLVNAKERYGFTGTLRDNKVNLMVLEGLFGPVYDIVSTNNLIEQKVLADFEITCLILKYPEETRKKFGKVSYQDEVDFIISDPTRNALIAKLAAGLKGNTMVMFQFIEKHGKILHDLIRAATDRPVYYIDGKVDGEERERIRKEIDTKENCILIGSAQTISTGINIVTMKNIIFVSPSKAKVRVLQAIGRTLRRSETKTQARLFDFVDDISWKKRKNFALIHFFERIKIYGNEQLPFKIKTLELK